MMHVIEQTEKPGPGNLAGSYKNRKTRNLAMSDFRYLCFIKTMRNVIYCLKVCVLTDI